MYSLHTIESLSKPQISRLLNGHGVRVRHGGHHKIHLSHEQSKKHHKAAREGKGYTLHFDPYQMAQHQHLRGKGTGTDLGHTLGGVAGSSAQVAGQRLNDVIIGTDPHGQAVYASNTSGTTMTASGVRRRGRPRKVGGAVNRINKFNRWTGALGDAYQGIAQAVKPVAQPIFQAGTARAVGYIHPTTTQDYINNSGMGIKRRGRPHKMHSPKDMHGLIRGGYVSKSDQDEYPAQQFYRPVGPTGSGMKRHRKHKHIGGAMYQSGLMGFGVHHKKKVMHRKKKHALLFDL